MWHPTPCFSSAHRRGMPMNPSARLFHCVRCHCQVILCRRCDRGHVYCANGCAHHARRDSLRRAGARYRATRRGRFNNALRQRRFCARQRKVTHHGSLAGVAPAVLPMTQTLPDSSARNGRDRSANAIPCHRCGCECSPFLRRDFLRSTARVRYPPGSPAPRWRRHD